MDKRLEAFFEGAEFAIYLAKNVMSDSDLVSRHNSYIYAAMMGAEIYSAIALSTDEDNKEELEALPDYVALMMTVMAGYSARNADEGYEYKDIKAETAVNAGATLLAAMLGVDFGERTARNNDSDDGADIDPADILRKMKGGA